MPSDTCPSSLTNSALLSIRAVSDPGTLPRLLEPFSKRGLVPSAVHARVSGVFIQVDLQIDGLDRDLVNIIAEGLRQCVLVERVLIGECLNVAVA